MKRSILCGFVCAVVIAPILSAQAEQAGEFVYADDPFEVSVVHDGEQFLFETGRLIYRSDTIVTGASSAEVDLFAAGATLIVAPQTRIRVRSLVDSSENASEGSGPSRMQLVRGKVRAVIHDNDRHPFNVTSRNGVAGVRGTDFVIEVRGDRVQLAVRTGEVEYTQRLTDARVVLGAGEGIDVDAPFAERIEVNTWTHERLDDFFESVGGYR
jgi:hypothetical protein